MNRTQDFALWIEYQRNYISRILPLPFSVTSSRELPMKGMEEGLSNYAFSVTLSRFSDRHLKVGNIFKMMFVLLTLYLYISPTCSPPGFA